MAERERRSNRPWKVMVAPGVEEGWRRVTLETEPDPVNTQIPRFLRRENRVRASTTSWPPCTSRIYGLIAGSGSRVIIIGGLGLFFDPGGLPLGLRAISIVAPSPPPPLPLGAVFGVVISTDSGV